MKIRPLLISQIVTAALITSPSVAAVYLTCSDLGNGIVELTYDSSEEDATIRAFALDVTVSKGVITAIDYNETYYNILPAGCIYIDEFGEIVDLPIPLPEREGTMPGLGTSGMTVERGTLSSEVPHTGSFCKFVVSAQCDVSVARNELRGGVILEDGSSPQVVSPGIDDVSPPGTTVYEGGGSGTPDDPYLISTPADMNKIGANPGDWHKHFKLVSDIDLGCFSGPQFNIIGTGPEAAFRGTFDGNGNKILNFTYSSGGEDCVGIFGFVDGETAQIKDLGLINPNINAGTSDMVGALVGYLGAPPYPDKQIGGDMSRCYVEGGSITGQNCVGALVGKNYYGAISNCYAQGIYVSGDDNIGGLVGRTYEQASNCYTSGDVSAGSSLVGSVSGFNLGSISDAFWDQDTFSCPLGTGGTGGGAQTDIQAKTTAEMKTKSTFTTAGWDFEGESSNGTEDIWSINEGTSYPSLVAPMGDFVGRDGVDMADFVFFAAAWRSSPGDENWNPLCDISDPNDNFIDEHDLSVFVDNYLTAAP